MLEVHQSGGKAVWVDLCEPTPEELARASQQFGVNVPPRSELEEIEFSSRLQYEDDVFTISVPVTPHLDGDSTDETSPLGFVLTKDLLITIRYAHLHTFPAIVKRVDRRPRSAPDVFLVILEALVDYSADRLEELRAEALSISNRIFHKEMTRAHKNVARTNQMLKATMVQIGEMGERLSHIRDTLLVLQRAVPFVTEHGDGWLEDAVKSRLKTAGSDVQSLNDYEVHLTDKIQFLLDATLGFINNEQNDLFKVLTVWSVAGIPPVLLAGIWGMNFHVMPELAWRWGYPMALTTIAISLIVPLVWFKKRGWW